MPKTKKETMKHKKQCTTKKTASKRQKKSVFKFDIKKILEERRLEGKLLKQPAIVDEEMIAADKLYQEAVKKMIENEDNDVQFPLESINSEHNIIIDSYNFGSNSNIPFDENSYSDLTKLCSERLKIMSVEKNELKAKLHFNHLMKENWSPVFDVCFKNNKFYSHCIFNK